MPVTIRGLDEVRAELETLKDISAKPTIILDVSKLSADKLGWLQDASRDFLDPGGYMKREMVDAARKGVRRLFLRGVVTKERIISEVWEPVGKAARDRVAKRLLGGGNELRGGMRLLKPATVKRKGHGIIGYDSGDLWRDVVKAPVIVRLDTVRADLGLLRAQASGSSVQRAVANVQTPSREAVAETRGYRRGLRVAIRAA